MQNSQTIINKVTITRILTVQHTRLRKKANTMTTIAKDNNFKNNRKNKIFLSLFLKLLWLVLAAIIRWRIWCTLYNWNRNVSWKEGYQLQTWNVQDRQAANAEDNFKMNFGITSKVIFCSHSRHWAQRKKKNYQTCGHLTLRYHK